MGNIGDIGGVFVGDTEDIGDVISDIQDIINYVPLHKVESVLERSLKLLKEQGAKRGKWVKQLSSCPSAIAVGGSRTSACTTCGGWGRKTFKYCPHCGAKMEKQEVKADD